MRLDKVLPSFFAIASSSLRSSSGMRNVKLLYAIVMILLFEKMIAEKRRKNQQKIKICLALSCKIEYNLSENMAEIGMYTRQTVTPNRFSAIGNRWERLRGDNL